MKKILFSTLILMSATSAIIAPPVKPAAVKPAALVVAAPIAAPVQASLADQIKAILAQITPGLAAVASKAQYIKDAFNALEIGLNGADLTTIDLNIKNALIDSCNQIHTASQDLINEIDPNGWPYWIKDPKSQTVKEMLALQIKINTCKEQIEGPSNFKTLMKPIKWASENKAKTAKVVVSIWVLHKLGILKHGGEFVYKHGGTVAKGTYGFIVNPIF